MAEQQQEPAIGGSFLDGICREWRLMADSIASESTLLADETNPDFQGHGQTAMAREGARQEQAKAYHKGGVDNIFVKPFINGAFSVRNTLRAQSHGPSHGGRDCGAEFAGMGGPMMGPPMMGPGYGF